MKIESVKVRLVDVHDEDLLAGKPHRKPTNRLISTLRVCTDDGIEGIGIAFVHGGLSNGMHAVLDELATQLVGENPQRHEQILAKLSNYAQTLSSSGIFLSALSAIDCAIWDIKAKVAQQPLWKLLGGYRDSVCAYASGTLHRGITGHALESETTRLVEKGFRTVKVHIGMGDDSTFRSEIERVRRVRDAAGPDIDVIAEVNERWRVGQAIDYARRMEDLGIFALEDPTRHDDYGGLSEIARALSTPVMAGENLWGISPFLLMLQHRSVDVLMIDIMHVGGITAWMKIAGLAQAYNIPVVSHIMPEFQAQLVGAVPNGLLAEYKAWTWPLFDGLPEFRDGRFHLSDRPGHGLSFSKSFENEAR